jgi:hypothetical protein
VQDAKAQVYRCVTDVFPQLAAVCCLSAVYLLSVCCLSAVCLLSGRCLSAVCLLYVCSLSSVCLFPVCLQPIQPELEDTARPLSKHCPNTAKLLPNTVQTLPRYCLNLNFREEYRIYDDIFALLHESVQVSDSSPCLILSDVLRMSLCIAYSTTSSPCYTGTSRRVRVCARA